MKHTRVERGSSLVVVLVIVVVLMGLGGAYLATTYVENQGTVASERTVGAKQADAAALDKARLLLFEARAGGGTWNDTLTASYSAFQTSAYRCAGGTSGMTSMPTSAYASGGTPYEGFVSTGAASSSDTETGTAPAAFYGRNFVHGDAVYNVVVADDDDGDGNPTADANNTLVVFTTVAAPANPAPGHARKVLGVTRAVVFFQPPQFMPENAIVTGGSLKIGGNPTIQGAQGSVHTNGDLIISGSPSISQVSSATGTITVTGSPSLGGTQPNAPTKPLPVIDPSQHVNKARYYLENDGKVYDNTTTPRTLLATGSWNGFDWSSSQGWSKGGSAAPPAGPIYINGGVKITGGGTAEAPWNTALLVNGTVEMSGNPVMTPFNGTVNGQQVKNVLILARGDVSIKGTGSSQPSLNGVIATHEQVDIAGTPTFTGSIVAEDAEDVFSKVTSISYIDILGNFTLTYDGGMDTFLVAGGTSVKVRSWDNYK